VRGHLRYYGVPTNTPALKLFRFQVGWLWHRALSRRSQNGRVLWDRMRRLIRSSRNYERLTGYLE
jgi:RNA-directed DNA polymerase